MRTPHLAGLLAVLLTGCLAGEISDVGGDDQGSGSGSGSDNGSGSGSDNTPTPKVTASIDKTAVSTELGKTENVVITVNSVDGFAGTVTVTPSVMGATGWTLTPTPATVDLAAGASAQVTLAVKVPTDTASLTPMLNVDLTSSAATASVSSAFTVANQYTITIPAGSGTSRPHAGLPAPNETLRLRMGAKVIFHNGDNVVHRIHADGGIQHESNELAAGADYVTTPTDNATWYCHDHEADTSSRPILLQ